eukprot:331931-Chlamydomonas_euryale.AAC.1
MKRTPATGSSVHASTADTATHGLRGHANVARSGTVPPACAYSRHEFEAGSAKCGSRWPRGASDATSLTTVP